MQPSFLYFSYKAWSYKRSWNLYVSLYVAVIKGKACEFMAYDDIPPNDWDVQSIPFWEALDSY
jgi:hypothetical protein